MTPPPTTTITKHTRTQNTSSSQNIPTKTGNLAACERWPKFLRCTYCTFLNQTAFNIQNPQSNTALQNINSHLHAQYCKTKLTTNESLSSVVTFKVKQQRSSPKNNEAWQFEFPERTVRGLLQSSQHWTSFVSCLAHIITLFMSAMGHVWRDTLNTGIQLSVQTWRENEIFTRPIVSKLQKKNQ